jgi:leader peptidase (prepilin peptidase)/N-methyltransferase
MNWLNFLDADTLRMVALTYWLVLAFVLGAAVGSFINVAAARLPLEKSLVWPGSRCGHCVQRIRWFDNLPLISYLWLRGRCRSCGGRYSSRYFWVELGTGAGFAGLLACEAFLNVHGWPGQAWLGMPPWPWLVGFGYHALLFTFLLTASVCDLRTREIPLAVTLTGTVVGLLGATMLPWPWPWSPALAGPDVRPGQPAAVAWQYGEIKQGVYPWPFWGPLPEPFAPGGNWQTGMATGIAGALAGTFLLRAVGFLFGTGLGKEALGLGDADLMMMAGAFLGWQVILIGFFVSVFPALLFGVVQLIARGDNALPFGPSLSAGVMITCLGWRWIGPSPYVQPILFNGLIVVLLIIAGAGILLAMSFALRLLHREPPAEA